MTWEVFVTVRLGTYRLKEVNVTSALGFGMIAVFAYLLAIEPVWR